MHAFLHQLRVSLSLHFRNRMALIYGYLFPTIFLIAFWVLYRYDRVPLARHMGELLTVTALGGACFGLPTTMVSERERGVWRRYRLAPVRTGTLLSSTIAARYVLLVLAGLLQVALAMLIGMPLPNHPLDLWIAFTFVAFALMGLGLVIATLADNVPAVQALGQCIFLPMLIIGGVAVQLTSLPEWVQHLSAFFPGRYAVEAMQTSVTGAGLGVMRFSLLALLLTGLAGFVAGIRMFRWDAEQRFVERGGKAWVAVALAAWAAVGVLAEARGRIGPVAIVAEYTPPAQPDERLVPQTTTPAAPPPEPAPPAAVPGGASPPDEARPAPPPEAPRADAGRPAPETFRKTGATTAGCAATASGGERQGAGATVDQGSAGAAAARAGVVAAGDAGAHRRGHVRAAAVRFWRGLADRAGRRADGARARDRARGSAHAPGHLGAGARRRSRAARAQSALRRRRARRLPDPAGALRPARRLRTPAGRRAEGRIRSRSSSGSPRIPPAATTAPSTISALPAFRSTARATWSRRASA